MSFFAHCLTVFGVFTVLIIGLFEMVMYPDMPLASNFLFGSFAAVMLAILYGWIFDMFFQTRTPGQEEQ